jgi:hypothetical protein
MFYKSYGKPGTHGYGFRLWRIHIHLTITPSRKWIWHLGKGKRY